jgi:hypothetical protein
VMWKYSAVILKNSDWLSIARNLVNRIREIAAVFNICAYCPVEVGCSTTLLFIPLIGAKLSLYGFSARVRNNFNWMVKFRTIRDVTFS